MAAYPQVSLSNTFDQWRISTNYTIDRLNKLANFGARDNVYGANGTFYRFITRHFQANVSTTFPNQANVTFNNVNKVLIKGGGSTGQYLSLANSTTGALSWSTVTGVTTFAGLSGKIANNQFGPKHTFSSNSVFSNGVTFAANVTVNSIGALKILGANTGQVLVIQHGPTGKITADTLGTLAQKSTVADADFTGVLTVAKGGHNSTTAAGGLKNLGGTANTYIQATFISNTAANARFATKAYAASNTALNTKLAVSNAVATFATIVNDNKKLAVANATAIYATKAYAASNTALNSGLSGKAALSQTHGMGGMLSGISNKDYRVFLKVPFAGTITETVTRSVSGTCTLTVKVNTTAVGGAAHSVSSTEQAITRSTSNTFAVDDDIVLTITSNSSCVDISFMIKFTRSFSA